ncbi:MAG: response regulator, partial [Ignavibacteriales bacterium]
SDTGIGIPKNNLNIIFDPFRQLSEGLSRNFEGAGLGLTVAKKFVEMMNGSIEVESEFGKGSTFLIKFPIFRRTELQPLTMDAKNMKNNITEEHKEPQPLQILLVEDDQSNAGVIKFFLESTYAIDSVFRGEDAIEKAASKKYDAVLMDIDLGTGMSGLEAAKKIKKIAGYEGTPIIAVTALAMRGDKEKFLTEGCTHYISKPFKKEDLTRIIKEAISKE